MEIPIQKLPHFVALPAYATENAAGMDLVACIPQQICIPSKCFALIPCGFALAIPLGYEGQIRSRSGLTVKHGVVVANSPGTIDADYRGEVKVCLLNLGSDVFYVDPEMRIAQLVICPVEKASWHEVDQLPPTLRGDGGFGSTGN